MSDSAAPIRANEKSTEMSHALTLITFVPIAGMVLILALPDAMKSAFKWIAAAATIRSS